jgi:Alpha/beta hydrolase domain
VQEADHPYTTRILVRSPRDRDAFSGDLLLELLHPEAGSETLWRNVRGYLLDRGDAYCQVTTRREPYNYLIQPPQTAIVRTKAFDPVRYAGIDFGDSGLSWDVISHVGRLLRSDVPENVLVRELEGTDVPVAAALPAVASAAAVATPIGYGDASTGSCPTTVEATSATGSRSAARSRSATHTAASPARARPRSPSEATAPRREKVPTRTCAHARR